MNALVIIPTYNEKNNVIPLASHILKVYANLHVLFVDDNSPDGTGQIVDKLAAENLHIHVLHREGKQGLGTAYIAGFKYAIKNNYDFAIVMDADFSHSPDELLKLMSKTGEYDIVVGSRYIKGVSSVNWPFWRLALSYFANKYIRFVTGLKVSDCTSGYKIYSRKVIETIDLNSIRSNQFSFQFEILFNAYQKGFTIGEAPIIFYERQVGKSKMSYAIVFEALFIAIRLRLRSIFKIKKDR